jgi:hypothetical protein
VRHTEGRVHGFLALKEASGETLASGTLTQLANGNRVTATLIFHFKDGSLHEETTVFSQARAFQLLTYHLVQKGKAFKRPTDLTINATSGQVAIRYSDDGKEKTINDHMKLPPDLANGMVPTLLSSISSKTPKTAVSMLVSTPKPRIVKLEISPAGEDSFSVAGGGGRAMRYIVKVKIGGISGVIAPIAGKQPPDTQVWIATGNAPGFLRSDGPLFEEGPVWRIELASPVWPKGEPAPKH